MPSETRHRRSQTTLNAGVGFVGCPTRRWKEIWDLTLRNPSFTTVRATIELQRWPTADRQAWESIWQEIGTSID